MRQRLGEGCHSHQMSSVVPLMAVQALSSPWETLHVDSRPLTEQELPRRAGCVELEAALESGPCRISE